MARLGSYPACYPGGSYCVSLDNRLETLLVCGAWIRHCWAWVAMASANKQLASPNSLDLIESLC